MNCSKAAPMTKDETMLFVQLVAANRIINNKATNATNNKLKDEAWQVLTDNFNSSITSFPRTPSQLRLKWENLKKSARKRCANLKISCNKTRGGKDYFPPDDVLDKVASILGNTCQGFKVQFGGDAVTEIQPNNSVMGQAIVNVEALASTLTTVDGVNTNGHDDDHSNENVIREALIIESPIPKAKKFFFSTPSGSGSLAKRKLKMEEEKCKARILRENAMAECLIAKKKKI